MVGETLINDLREYPILVEKGEYCIFKSDYEKIIENADKKVYTLGRNIYSKTKAKGFINADCYGMISKELNRILWNFLLTNPKSKKDLKRLDRAIEIFNNASNTIEHLSESKPALEYIHSLGHKTYLDFDIHYKSLYGIDIWEYCLAGAERFTNYGNDCSEDSREDKYAMVSSSNITEETISLLKRSKEKADYSSSCDYSLSTDDIKGHALFPTYRYDYGLPLLQIIKSSKIAVEFNMLDDKKDMINQLNKVHGQEKALKDGPRSAYSSSKLELLKLFGVPERLHRIDSISVLHKASIIYRYIVDGEAGTKLEDAGNLYNFHVFLHNFERKENIEVDGSIYMCKSADFVTDNVLKGEIAKQVNTIKSLLNL